MNIGVDVDGVLTDIGRFMQQYGEPYFADTFGLPVADPRGYSIDEMFACTYEQRKSFWWKYGAKYLFGLPPKAGCADSIRRLRGEGHSIHIITSRTLAVGHGLISVFFRWVLRHWLRKNRIKYDGIVFCSEEHSADDKVKACAERSIDVMIEDKKENVLALKDKVRTLCLRCPWNEELEGSGVEFVESWEEIERIILERSE